MPNPTDPVCKFAQGCHRVVPCDPGCGTPHPTPALRDRIAKVLAPMAVVGGTPPQMVVPLLEAGSARTPRIVGWQPLDALVDQLLAAALPPATNRAAVYREVADRLAADAESGAKEGFTRIYRRSAAKQVREWAAEAQQPDDTDLTETDIDRMMAAGVPVQIVTAPPATRGAEAQQQPETVPDPTWPRRAWDLGLLHTGGDPHRCPACLRKPEPPVGMVCPGDNTEVLANPQPEAVDASEETCDGCGHTPHRADQCQGFTFNERCECDEPIAAEAQQPETELLFCVCGAPAVRDGDRWAHHPGTGDGCLYRPDARPRCPKCRMPHDLTPGSMGMRACASILASLAEEERRG